jgi:glucose-6-phosphate isomerase
MGLIHLDLEHLLAPTPNDAATKTATDRFIADMQRGVSGFFDLPETSSFFKEYETIKPQLARRAPEVRHFIHIGIGGSSLGPETLVKALSKPTAPQFHFLDNIDPDALADTLQACDPAHTLVYVVTKSGGTYETMATFMVVYHWLEKALGSERAKNHLVFCTDPEKGDLRKLAIKWQIPTFEIPSNVGGRFSVLTAVGLFPALVAGISAEQLLQGANQWRNHFLDECTRQPPCPTALLASHLIQMAAERPITVLMPYSQKLKTFAAWFTQLWAESLGKNGKGLTPVAAVGATDQHSILQLLRDGPQDKVIGFMEVQGFNRMQELQWKGPDLSAIEALRGATMNQLMDAELHATRQVMTNQKRPQFSIVIPKLNAHALGQLFFFTETLTAIAGYVLEINPFDQPGVEEGKILTKERIAACKKSLMS